MARGGGGDYSRRAIILNISVKGGRLFEAGDSPVPELSFLPAPYRGWTRRAKEESRITCMRMLRTNQSKITRSQSRCSRQCVAQCLLCSRSERKHFLRRWYCRKKHKKVKIEILFIVVCAVIDDEYASLLSSQTFFSFCLWVLSDFAKFLKGKCDAHK